MAAKRGRKPKLTAEQVAEIMASRETAKQLAERFHVSMGTIYNAVRKARKEQDANQGN